VESKKEKKKHKPVEFVIEEYGKLRDDVEKAIRIHIKVKIHKPESVTDDEFRALEKDPEFKKKVEELVKSYIKDKRKEEG
jgi:hypothetical protein